MHFSDDAGLTWTNQGAALAAQGVMSIDFYDANIGVAAGVTGLVSVTIDGGTNWAAATVPEAQTINSIRFTGPSSQHLVCATLNGNVWYSRDRGTTWTETWAGNGTAIKCLDVASPTVYFLIDDDAGSNDIYQTVDGGLSFQEYTTPANTELEHIIVLSPTLVFAVGNAGAAVPTIIKLGTGVS